MKLLVIFVAIFCATQAKGSKLNFTSAVEELQEVTYLLEYQIYHEVERFNSEIAQSFADQQAEAEKIVQQSKQRLHQYVFGVVGAIESQLDDRYPECFKGQREKLAMASEQATLAYSSCVSVTKGQIESLKSIATYRIALIMGQAEQIRVINEKCLKSEDEEEMVSCFFIEMKAIREISSELVAGVRDILASVSIDERANMATLNTCDGNVTKQIRNQVISVNAEIKKCIESTKP